MKISRIVIDTNVIVSGLLFGGISEKILALGFSGDIAWLSAAGLLDELENTLTHKKFGLAKEDVELLVTRVSEAVQIVVIRQEISIIKRKPGDNRVLECAVDGKADFIVTGDRRDLVSLKVFRDIPILAPRDFLDLIN